MRFFASGFFLESAPYGPLIHAPKYFWFPFRIRRDIQIWKWFRGVSYPAEQKTIFKIRGFLSMDSINLGLCNLYMQTIFEKCPCKENGKLSKLFRLILRGLNLPVGPDALQNKILRGIKPRRTRSCWVSDPTEPRLAGYQTPLNIDRDVYKL
jgi:hypothetical protein